MAVEVKEPTGLGRCRMAILTDGSATSLHPFVTAHVEPGATVITAAWQGYSGINELGYTRDRRSQRAARLRGHDEFALLPGVHRVALLAKRRLLGTHQGSVDEADVQAYLDEFVFRFTAAPPAAAASSSTAFSTSLSGTNPSATATSSSPPRPRQRRPPGGPAGVTRPPSTARRSTAHGETPDRGLVRLSGYP